MLRLSTSVHACSRSGLSSLQEAVHYVASSSDRGAANLPTRIQSERRILGIYTAKLSLRNSILRNCAPMSIDYVCQLTAASAESL